MRIGLILSSIPGYSETFFKNFVIGLQSRGHEVVIFANNGSYEFHKASIQRRSPSSPLKNIYFLAKFLFFFNRCRKYFNLNRDFGCSSLISLKRVYLDLHILTFPYLDWIHFGFGTQGLGREHLAKALDVRSAVSFRGFDISIYPLKYPNCYVSLLKEVDKVHVISDDIDNILKNNYTFDYQKTFKITPAINVEKFKSSIKRNWHQLTFVSVGRLHWKKGLNYVIEALAVLNNKGYEFSYSIIGTGVDYEQIAFLANEYGILDKIKFLGKIDHYEIPKYLNNANYFLQYSVQEGFGNAVLEAQASGLISVVSDAEGLSENICHSETGFVVPKLKPNLLAQQILQIHKLTAAEKQQISDTAVKRVEQFFGVEKQIDAFEKFYK